MVATLFNERIHVAETFSEDERLVAICGDALECAKSLPTNFFSLIITSPPYNLGKEYEQRSSLQNYPREFYRPDYKPTELSKGAFRDMDFLKEKLGVEVQFGKYSFMVYNVCAKMTIFKNLKHINAGIEIVPVKNFADQMSTGVSYFEQFVWDLHQRGVADIDVPVLIIGIDA
jgi:hypothetical protein